MDVRGGDVCFRANFATVEEREGQLVVLDRRAGRLSDGRPFEDAINRIYLREFGLEMAFRASTEHRGALLLRGEALSVEVSDTDPHEIEVPIAPAQAAPAAQRVADAVNAFTQRAHEVLRDHPVNRTRASRGELPANAILLRGAAAMPYLKPITEEYGIRAVCIAGGALYKGVARLAGLTVLDVPGATVDLQADLRAMAQATRAALGEAEFVFVHIKGTDNAAHDGDAQAKKEFIERVDREFFGELVSSLPGDVHLCVSGDHTTPPAVREHTADPVPVLFVGPAVRPDRTQAFGERAAAEGGLGRFSGRLVPQLLGYCDLGPKFGA
jgi:2,3-bisphosphoglycerate-independent phosphoglycerate mutase